MALIEEFLREVDAKWKWPGPRIRLHVIGSAALMLQADYQRGTKDGDILQTTDISPEIEARLLDIAGEGTAIHTRRRLYIDIVGNGVPFLPQEPDWVAQNELSASLAHFDIDVLGIVDVVVSKLKRFSPNDISDIEAMVGLELVRHEDLVERFRLAIDYWSTDQRAVQFRTYIDNLHRVERDMLAVSETEIELPSWI